MKCIFRLIVKDISKLNTKCEPTNIKDGEEIAVRLLHELRNSEEKGIGLAANQIGINKRVCVVNVKEPIVLINPEIIERSEKEFIFPEGCLSFPNKKVRTKRNVSIKVKADNHKETLSFSADSKEMNDAFECVCVQHEIDHLDGITMFDREFKQVPIKRVGRKIGRNDKVMITKGSESKTIKYKKAEPMLEDGWVLSN